MLEFYQDDEEALRLLQNYASNSDFPPNPNAYVYLYMHQNRRNAAPDQLRRCLKVETGLGSDEGRV